ncbi:keratin, type I cytoskeletal 13-like [Clarias gariepinus]|uniref:keratin, type I cytoskeletal 13-like n=1 Tax=Clarias gariepinus TaxID=13013 RepID=UPI00234CA7AB|nr:keratin, type I cytoskeletal 13-like [Clarias gariepinus]
MASSSITSRTLSFRRGFQGGSIQAGGGIGLSGGQIFQASKGAISGAYRSGLGLGVGLGSGIGASSAAGFFGSGLGRRVGFGVGGIFGGGAVFAGDPEFAGDARFGGGGFRSHAGFVGEEAVGILGNEKFTLRILNDRLASYLKKVQLLERTNAELELKISQFVGSRTSPAERDFSDSLTIIDDLHDKILGTLQVKSVIFLTLDNVNLSTDDFRIKYENELALRQTLEADVAGLKRLLNDINLSIGELTLHIDTLIGEMTYLKRSHEEKMVNTRSRMSGQIHVAVEAPPQQELTSVLEDIRDHYETVTAKNQRELESWFKSKVVTVGTVLPAIIPPQTELSAEKTTVQSLEVELQSVTAMKASLVEQLSETENFYAAQLSGFQLQVTNMEELLLQLRADLERQGYDYQILLDLKTRLEREITDYRRLLDIGVHIGFSSDFSTTSKISTTRFLKVEKTCEGSKGKENLETTK